MCGFAGFWDQTHQLNSESAVDILTKMTSTLAHRGPDDQGLWLEPETGIALGHRRLSIIDLSLMGHQPMFSSSGRYVIVFNGEIYNFPDIKSDLIRKGVTFRGGSDTEVILAAIEEWGLEKSVKQFVGMFAFALWDNQSRIIHLVRDRFGEKPLYYSWVGKVFVFASELKAIRSFLGFRPNINRNALASFLRYCYIPCPYSIYEGIFKLEPGSIITVNPERVGGYPTPQPYWSAFDTAVAGIHNRSTLSQPELLDQLETLLVTSVKQQMIADVPLGAFLSGGIDSSTIVALMQSLSNRAIKTFSIGFYEDSYNEAQYSSEIAKYLGTDHTEVYVTSEEAMQVIPRLSTLYDEPFSDSSQIPTYLVASLARQSVTVSLSGDGGDELFGGYNRYFWGQSIWDKVGWMPGLGRKTLASFMTIATPYIWDKVFTFFAPCLPTFMKQRLPGDKIHKLAEVLAVDSPEEMYKQMVSCWKDPNSVVINGAETESTLIDNKIIGIPSFSEQMMYFDLITYLPDDILVKVDRACMGVSLESRIPFLDHRVVEYAWQLPFSMKIRNGTGKWLLRQLLYKYVPQHLIERPKMGFGVPIDSWLREGLKDWAEDLLAEERLTREGFFNVEPVRTKWREHLSGNRNWQHYLWSILMFQAWLEEN